MHIHVGHNIPGYLPESMPMCFDSEDDALDALKHGLRDQQEYYWEGCEAESPEQREKGSECCGWCDVAGNVEAALSTITDGDAKYYLYRLDAYGSVGWTFSPPEGADMHFWAAPIQEDRESCECNPDSDSYVGG